MGKIFIRAGYTPFEVLSPEKVMCDNLIGSNVGNLIYAYGVFRTLMTSECTEFIPNRYQSYLAEADWINETCDCFIIPLADMFRPEAIREMHTMTELVKRLKIPCVIIGVGVRATLDCDLSSEFPFDEAVKEFVNAILEKSAMIGVRGERTARYLERLGYIEDKHFMVIGCPSMYAFGGELTRRALQVREDMKVAVNASVMSTPNTLNLLFKLLKEMPNSYFLPQRINELWTLYTGLPYKHLQNKPMYPIHISDTIYQQDRVKYFLNAKSWTDYLKTMDLSIGGRMHGNIAAIQAGTPCVLIPHDSRMKELTDYHKLPHIMGKEVDENWCLQDIIDRIDFEGMYKQHGENFRRYISFLDKNEINHIYKESEAVENAPFDKKISAIDFPGELKSAATLSTEELACRWQKIVDFQKGKTNDRVKDIESKYRALNKSSIKNDIKCLGVKVIDKMKGEKRSNYERILEVKKC